MKAVVYAGEGRVEVDTVADPQIQEPTDALVKVSRTAICGSDLHLLDGKTPGMREGSVIGHEFVGVITDLGNGVTRHSEGTRVLGSFLIACGNCPSCAANRFNFCTNRRALGLGTFTGDLDGAQAEYVRVPGADLNLKLLDGALSGLSDEQALFGGDILTTGFYAAELAEPQSDDIIVIVGAGPVGLFTAAALRGRCARVILLDSDQNRVDFAQELLGRDTAFLVGEDPHPVVARETGGQLASVAIDAVGSVDVFKSALKLVREGGAIVVVGVYGAERVEMSMGRAWVRGLQVRFSGMGNIHAHWDAALMTVAKGGIDPTRLITHRLSIDEAVEGYRAFAAREATKVVLIP
jgi:threonine dehydrogenase-like Zn-dependent dehydrogenase